MRSDIPKIKIGRAWKYDLSGIRFGYLTAVKETKERNSRQIKWKCLCDCGAKSIVASVALVNGHTKSCGCQGKISIGKRFGKLTVTSPSSVKTSSGQKMWNCLCDCGNKARVRSASLNNGNTKSCGCLKINNLRGINNYQAQRMVKDYGVWISSRDPYYVRASQMWGRIKEYKIPTDFNSIVDIAAYLKKITPKRCPVFKVPLTTGKQTTHKWSPSADRIDPAKGYTRDNIQVISQFANVMKQNATNKELKQFARWVMER